MSNINKIIKKLDAICSIRKSGDYLREIAAKERKPYQRYTVAERLSNSRKFFQIIKEKVEKEKDGEKCRRFIEVIAEFYPKTHEELISNMCSEISEVKIEVNGVMIDFFGCIH